MSRKPAQKGNGKYTYIRITVPTRASLTKIGSKSETYDTIIKRLLSKAKK